MSKEKYLLVIAGPTAVGKTSLSIRLAKYFNTEIISADSRQFFKELSIGTAKPSKGEMQGVVHHFIDSHSINEDYNAGKFETDALKVLKNIFLEHDIAIMVGGSGLYIKAVCEGMDELPEADLKIREDLILSHKEFGLDPLLQELQKKDTSYYEVVDKANTQRIIRALEVIRSTGKPFSSFQKNSKKNRDFKIIKIGLNIDRKQLYKMIDDRMDLMLAKGLLDEAKEMYPYKDRNALKTVGYEEIFDFLDGHYSWEETVRLLKRNSRRYAKRQLTWFNKDQEIAWYNPVEPDKILQFIEQKIKAG